MKVCFVGSRELELDGNVAIHLLTLLTELEPGTKILLREPLHRPVRPFETLVSVLSSPLGFEVEPCIPVPGGRSKVFLRDVEMVQKADQVIALFPEGGEMVGGTAHVVEKALDQKKPVRAYAIDGEEMRLVGSEDWSMEG